MDELSEQFSATPLQKLNDPLFKQKGVNLYIKREDMLHPGLSGNKWHKLKLNIEAAKQQGYVRLLSFGGAYSNHLHALAMAGKLFDIETIGVVRGEELAHKKLNTTLSELERLGMHLHFVDRTQYRNKTSETFISSLHKKFAGFYLLPEGGSNILGAEGCAEFARETIQQGRASNVDFDYIVTACGTGTTLAGMAHGLARHGWQGQELTGVLAVNDESNVRHNIVNLLESLRVKDALSPDSAIRWHLDSDYHFGGFAKLSQDLLRFSDNFNKINKVELDPIYTAKAMFAIYQKLERQNYPEGSKVLMIHTGGLQGTRGMAEKIRKYRSSNI